MKKYLFGYLFVRVAKLLAVLTFLAGVGYALFRLEQASLAAQSASYQPSPALKQSLGTLKDRLAESTTLVNAFCAANGGTAPMLAAVDYPATLNDNEDFRRLGGELARTNQQRRQLKESLVTRFEALITATETKLRAHAAAVAPVEPTTAQPSGIVVAPAPRPTPEPTEQVETLYSGQLDNGDIVGRTALLDRGKDFLKVLQTAAENPANRQTLTDSMAQLDAFVRLLPAKTEAPGVDESPAAPERPSAVPAPRREFNAEKVANQLARLRNSVRQTMLTTWTLDAAYARAADLAGAETARCRVDTLTVKGIWVAAFGQLGLALLVAIFVAFLVLVLADFMQTLLDTATNTGITADAAKSRS